MSKFIKFSQAEKEQARTTDLAEFLTAQGEEVKKMGSEYLWMDGGQRVTIRDNLWFHQYEQKGGDSIDFVRRYYHKGYGDAVQMLLGNHAGTENSHGSHAPHIIIDNTQLMIFGGFAPNSSSAEILSKSLGSRTVMSGSVSKSKNEPSQSLQMIERPLMTPDELKSLPKGTFIVMKTGFYPMKVKLKLFFDWGITFEEPYTVSENGNRIVRYANKREIINGILERYPIEIEDEQPPQEPPKSNKGGNSTSPLRTAPGGENEPFEDFKEETCRK